MKQPVSQFIIKANQEGKKMTISQFIKANKDAFYYGRHRFRPILIAESIDGRIRIYLEFSGSTPLITVMEQKASGFYEPKRDHPWHKTTPTKEVKKVLVTLGF